MSKLAILVRHAKPLELDPAKKLSDSGKKMQATVNAFLKELEIEPTEIWTSPVLRAKETAELIGRDFNKSIQEEPALGELELFDEIELNLKLKELPDESTVIMVSHAPQIMRLATYWIGMQYFALPPPTSSALFLVFADGVDPGRARPVRFVTYSDLTT